MTVKAAAELALSGLGFANYMKLTEIQRALIQCKEQSNEMLEKACVVVESCVKRESGGGASGLFEILFTLARRWEELFVEDLNLFNARSQAVVASVEQPGMNQLGEAQASSSEPLASNQNAMLPAVSFDLNKFQQHQQQQQHHGLANSFFHPSLNFNQPQNINTAFSPFQGKSKR